MYVYMYVYTWYATIYIHVFVDSQICNDSIPLGGPNFFRSSGSQLICRPSSCWPKLLQLEACSALVLHRSDWWLVHQPSTECDHQSLGTVILEASVGKQEMSLQPISNTFNVYFFLLVNKIRDRLLLNIDDIQQHSGFRSLFSLKYWIPGFT